MNIAVDVRPLFDGRLSGIQRYTGQLLRALLQVAPQHHYHLFYNAARPVARPALAGPVTWHGFRYPNKLFNAMQWMSGWPRWDKLVPADCFLVPNLGLMPLSLAVPLVTVVHDLSYEYFPEFFSGRHRRWHRLIRPRRLLERSQHVIAVSQATAADVLERYGLPHDKVSVVYSGVVEGSEQSRAAIGVMLPEKYILSFGAFEPRKNITGALRAFAAVADRQPHHLVVAGAAGWLMRSVRRQAERSRWRGRIHFLGPVDEEDRLALLTGASLLLYPSFYEGFGFPPLEALVAGTPVVAARNSALPEIVGQWATLVDSYDTAELALVLDELLGKEQRVPVAVRRAIVSRYSWAETARQTVAVLERVV